MLTYILKRTVATIITLWVVISLTFFMMRAIPGGPFDGEKKVPPQIKANLEEKFGMNKPLMVQYTMYLRNLLHGDMGPSMKYEGRTVNEVISYSIVASAKLGGVTVLFVLIAGVLMGITAALHQGKWQDQLCLAASLLGVTVPSFVLATFFIYLFAVKLKLLPAVGFDGLKFYVLPCIALGGSSMAFIARLTRSRLLDVVRQDFIRTAKAKGLSANVVTYKHALRNSIIPVITYVGPLIAGIVTGSFVIESIFGIPGLGREFVQSINNRDYTTLLGLVVVDCSLLLIANLIVDILYGIIDPRIKLEG